MPHKQYQCLPIQLQTLMTTYMRILIISKGTIQGKFFLMYLTNQNFRIYCEKSSSQEMVIQKTIKRLSLTSLILCSNFPSKDPSPFQLLPILDQASTEVVDPKNYHHSGMKMLSSSSKPLALLRKKSAYGHYIEALDSKRYKVKASISTIMQPQPKLCLFFLHYRQECYQSYGTFQKHLLFALHVLP